MSRHGLLALVVGEERPAMAISWEPPTAPIDSGFIVSMFDDRDDHEGEAICLGCLLEDGDEQLGRGLDLAKQWGRCVWDVDAAEWYYPSDAEWMGES